MKKMLRIGDVVSIERGTTYKSALIGMPGPVLLGLGSIERNGGFRGDSLRTYGGESPERLLVKPGQLYVSLKDVTQSADLLGAVARVPQSGPVGRLTQDTVRLEITDNRVTPEYLHWVLRTPQYRQYCRSHLTGTTNLGLPREDFLAFTFPEPDADSAALVAAVESLDEKITSNLKLQVGGESLVRAIVERAIARSDGASARLDSYCQLAKVTAKPDELTDKDHFIGLEHMPRGSLFLDAWEPAVGIGSNKWRFAAGDVLFGKLRPYFKKVGIAPVAGVCSTDILVIRPLRQEFTPLVAVVASSDPLIDSLSAGATGTRMPRASWDDLAQWPLPALSGGEIEGLAETCSPLLTRMSSLTQENARLRRLRDALIPQLVSEFAGGGR